MYDNICFFLENHPLKEYTSMKTGGNARVIYFPKTREQLTELVKRHNAEKQRFVIFGNLSNVLVPDEGFDVPCILTTEMKNYEVSGCTLSADCGVMYTKLSMDMCRKGLSGLEFAYGIPGTVGGAVYMNAGAYGGETKDVVKRVYALDENCTEVVLHTDACKFDYRTSVFDKEKYVILGADFELKPDECEKCVAVAKEFMSRRIEKQPLEFPSCGSTFKRPVGFFAGKLIEDSGLKGKNIGGAYVSEKHSGFVVNKGGATSADVLSLMSLVSNTVYEKFGVRLENEIRLVDKNGEEFSI